MMSGDDTRPTPDTQPLLHRSAIEQGALFTALRAPGWLLQVVMSCREARRAVRDS